MENNEAIFESDNYKIVNELVNEKIHLLRKNKNFEKKYVRFFEVMENLGKNLNNDNKMLFDEFVELNYQTEEYYLALAFSLGVKYGNELNKI